MGATGKPKAGATVGANSAATIQIQVNGRPEKRPVGTTIAQLLEALQLGQQRCAVEVNQRLVRRDRHGSHELRDGDQIEVVTLVGGG